MSLQDIVLDTLPPEPPELSLTEILLRKGNAPPSSGELADMAGSIAEGNFEEIPRFAAWMCSSVCHLSSWPRTSRGVLLMLFRADEASRGNEESALWIQEQFQEFQKDILQTEKLHRRHRAIGNFQGAVQYLETVLREETLEIISEICNVTKPTARKWLLGGTPRPGSDWRVCTFAREVFIACEEKGVLSEDILLWLRTPLASGQKPLETGYPLRTTSEVLRSLEDLHSSSSSS